MFSYFLRIRLEIVKKKMKMESRGGKIKEMDGINSLFGLFLLLLHLLISADETECKNGHDSNQTSSGGHHPRPLCVTQKISNSLRQVITGKKNQNQECPQNNK